MPEIREAQAVERIQEQIVETIDQEELDQLRNDWMMGEFELEKDEDGRRERKPSRKKNVNRTRIKHPISSDVVACCCAATARFMYTVLRSAFDFTKVFLNEMLARGALVILNPWSQDFGRKLIGAGLLSGALVSKRHICVKLAVSEQHWRVQGTVSDDTVGDPLKGHCGPVLNNCSEAHCDPQLAFGSAIAAHRFPREVRLE